MPRLTACYIDFQSAHCYRAWRWLRLAGVHESVEFRPFSLEAGQGEGPWDRQSTTSKGLELLALGELARETGSQVHRAFIEAAFAGLHDDDSATAGLEAWLALGSEAGLDLDRFTADSERWRAEVGLWHAEARDELGVTGAPTLVFDDRWALSVRFDRAIGDADAARRLLQALAELATVPVSEVRRAG